MTDTYTMTSPMTTVQITVPYNSDPTPHFEKFIKKSTKDQDYKLPQSVPFLNPTDAAVIGLFRIQRS